MNEAFGLLPLASLDYSVSCHIIEPEQSMNNAPRKDKFEENMVVSVEMYAGKVGEQNGVKLEEEVWITADGPVILSLYPYEAKLLGE